ncbi:MAG: rane protein insertase YidC [Burkholderiales bacterium]|jgi:YidC/Oxa1 family membrane protein insertase|nr:rane protein insertase YidC [Burkholderiales bacterium]
MDSRRLILFIALSLGLMLVWEKFIAPQQPQVTNFQTATNNTVNGSNNQVADNNATLNSGNSILVTTDLFQAKINSIGGDLRDVDLLNHGRQDNPKEPYPLLLNDSKRVFIAQTGLVGESALPTHTAVFTSDKPNYVLEPNQKTLTVNLNYTQNGINVTKSYTFTRGSYVINIAYKIDNNTPNSLSGISAYWRLLRDEEAPEGETKFVHTFTGPAYYTSDAKFNTIKFSNLAKNDVSYPEATNNGWVGFIQHYFTALWLLNPYNQAQVCANGVNCRLNFKPVGNLASSGVLTDLPVIKANSSYTVGVPLFVGPEDYKILTKTAPNMELTKDYGWVYIFSTPLFWLLVKIFDLVHNWGIAIILLTLVVKTVLYPLTRASYISMAKMKALGPKMEALKAQHKDDKVKLQQAIMGLYRSEKVNPIGGCLPMLMQIPVFIGLYWALLSSVELRQAPFLWVHDLSLPDPYYILPVILAITMFLQTFLNPPPSDPVQAKMMKIMPVAFSVMFFFFPAGLVLYWLVNNVLSMAQQWYVNNHVTLRRKDRIPQKKK